MSVSPVLPKPAWIRAHAPSGAGFERIARLVREQRLHTVCEEAHCPNRAECWNQGTATFIILGDICTRACRFCAVQTGRPPAPLDAGEPRRVAMAVARMGLRHAVVTSVTRDDQGDGGASCFFDCVREIRALSPECRVELLVPDFNGNWAALDAVIEARPDVLNHNIETVRRLYGQVRPGACFERSLDLLGRAKARGLLIKSGIMVGLGESWQETRETIEAIHAVGTDILTIGQYLRPSMNHLPVARYYTPEEFGELRAIALEMGFMHVEAGPLVRSSYHADEQAGMLTRK